MIIIPDFLPLQEKSGHEGFDESRIVGVIPNGQEQKIQRGCKNAIIDGWIHQGRENYDDGRRRRRIEQIQLLAL